MSDIKELLSQTARSAEATPSPEVVDADVHRGRAALVRRRRRRAVGSTVGGTVAAAALVAATIVVGNPDGSSETPAVQPDRVTSPNAASGVRLVAYTGEQPAGFFVDWVPEGWYIQDPAHAAYSLTIAPKGDTSHPDGYVGKLVVFLLTSSAPQRLPDGEPVKVGEYDGVIHHGRGSEADTLTYEDDAGHFVQVQVWHDTLNWTDEQLIRFAEGVTATADAKAGVG